MKKRTHGATRSPRSVASCSTRAYMSMSSFLPAVHEPAYAMSTRTRSASPMCRPFPGSPGRAIIGRIAPASISITSLYSASGSLARSRHSAAASRRAGVRGVRVAPDDDHAGLGMPLEDLRMADRLRAVSRESQLAVQADALFLGELALLLLQLQRHVQQPFLDALRRHRLAQEREV